MSLVIYCCVHEYPDVKYTGAAQLSCQIWGIHLELPRNNLSGRTETKITIFLNMFVTNEIVCFGFNLVLSTVITWPFWDNLLMHSSLDRSYSLTHSLAHSLIHVSQLLRNCLTSTLRLHCYYYSDCHCDCCGWLCLTRSIFTFVFIFSQGRGKDNSPVAF